MRGKRLNEDSNSLDVTRVVNWSSLHPALYRMRHALVRTRYPVSYNNSYLGKMGRPYDFTECCNVIGSLYTTDVIATVAELIAHSPVAYLI